LPFWIPLKTVDCRHAFDWQVQLVHPVNKVLLVRWEHLDCVDSQEFQVSR